MTSEDSVAVVRALLETNPGAIVEDRGSYVRVKVAGRCVLNAATVARFLGRPFLLPMDLEKIMPSFKGRLSMVAGEVVWQAYAKGELP